MPPYTRLAPLYRVNKKSWLGRQVRRDFLTATGLRRRDIGYHEARRLERQGVLIPVSDLSGLSSLGFPILDVVAILTNPGTLWASVPGFVEGDTRPAVRVAFERRALREAAAAASQPPAGNDDPNTNAANPGSDGDPDMGGEGNQPPSGDDQGESVNPEVNTEAAGEDQAPTGEAAPQSEPERPQEHEQLDAYYDAQDEAAGKLVETESQDNSLTGDAAPASRARNKRNAAK